MLRLGNFSGDDDHGFARAIAAATSLSSLELTPLLDSTFLLALLPRLLKLEELTLKTSVLRVEPALLNAPVPRHLRTPTLTYCTMDDATGLLHWASSCLATVALNMCDKVCSKPAPFGHYLRRWIAGGITTVMLKICEWNAKSIFAVASSLCNTRRSSPFLLWLDVDTMRLESFQVLLEALVTCTGVSIQGDYPCGFGFDERAQIQSWVTQLHLRREYTSGYDFHILSPS
ncbi:hypothetical protein SPRG_16110 [Saprolegnia parasitica CBS 223.65]|uniref:Uncharacterized protein n=1 Tax=Saprolegnia parasitica (strain CBS 223.65) TaxID=695850 RepID=A0A067BK42_SAPPC|nr:hypothetical protein SPRG_16110 [Saprolegnia parasitica CBS 223.65]KDO18558.1 hypothetical protein SPRG_16110 [Saprolegnia parasitica CBS 223.65]|eukprot:XP_012210728.1 hypothetical protein SPRG_16110 [Saprolegnia parasitica CBS 223.65]